MSAGLMLLIGGVLASIASLVLLFQAVRKFRTRKLATAIGMLAGAAVCGLGGYIGIYGAFRMPYLQLMPVCAANLRGIAMALELYEKEFNCRPMRLRELVDAELATPKHFFCPLVRSDGQNWNPDTAPPDFSFVPDASSGDPAHWIVAFDNGDHHGDETRTVVFRDGLTQLLRAEEFEARMRKFVTEFTELRKRKPLIVE